MTYRAAAGHGLRQALDRSVRSVSGWLGLVAAVALVSMAMAACATGSVVTDDDGNGSGASTSANSGGSGQGGAGGSPAQCASPTDCPGMDTTCAIRTCTEGMCGTDPAAEGTPCSDDGGSYCDGEGACVECIEGSQCPSEVCVDGMCADPACDDTVLNGNETDIDCGGSDCPSCVNGEMCVLASDCVSLFCDVQQSPAVCAPCSGHDDCAGAPGTYCEMGACVPQKGNGSPCMAPEECSSGFCPAEGVCCDTACDLGCESCLMSSTMISDGTCAPTQACMGGDDCCPAGCNDINDSDCALLDLAVGTHSTIYSAGNATRGFWFTAPVAFTIQELRVPIQAGTGAQNLQVVLFSQPPPTYPTSTTNFTTLHYTTGTPGAGFIQVNIPVAAGDVIGILGARGSGQLNMSYSSSNPVNTTIFGQPVALNRLVYQANMVSTPAGPLSFEAGGSIGRVDVRYGL